MPGGLLQPLPPAKRLYGLYLFEDLGLYPFGQVTMDFVALLPTITVGYDAVFTIFRQVPKIGQVCNMHYEN